MAHDEAFASRHIYAGEELWRREFDSFDVFCRKRDAARAKAKALQGDHGALRGLILAWAEALERDAEALAVMVCEEVGRCLGECRAELAKSALLMRYYADRSEALLADRPIATAASSSWASFEPLGTILAVMPWNYPVWQALRFAIPALCAGNACLVKPAPSVGRVSEALLRLAPAPLPFDLVCLSRADTQRAIDLCDGLAFTGSAETGSKLAARAGAGLKKSVMELGGSNPLIVLDDADLGAAARAACYSRFRDAGQSCNAAKRIVVERAVAPAFVDLFVEEARKLRPGDPMDPKTTLAALHLPDAPERMAQLVADALGKGARLLLGGERIDGPFYPATVLADAPLDARLATEESFGPVAPIFVVDGDEEAIETANATPFGLGAAIFGSDLGRASRIAKRIEAGSVYVNRHTSSDINLPFGGVKRSGYGRELSSFGLYEFVNVKSNWVR